MYKCVNGYTFLLYWTFTNISLPLVTIFDLSPFCLEIATLTLFWLLFAWNFFFPSFLSQSSLFSSLQCLPSTPYWQGLELHHLAKEKGLWVQLQYHICVLCAKLLQSCPTLCHPMDCSLPGSSLLPHGLSLPGSSVHGILQTRLPEGLPFPPPGVLPEPGIKPVSLKSPASAGSFSTTSTICSVPQSRAKKEWNLS